MNSGTVPMCGYCGRPIATKTLWLGGRTYHYECTRGPGAPMTYTYTYTGQETIMLTEDDVRRIVREELKSSGAD